VCTGSLGLPVGRAALSSISRSVASSFSFIEEQIHARPSALLRERNLLGRYPHGLDSKDLLRQICKDTTPAK
jgi:hypothetical protein